MTVWLIEYAGPTYWQGHDSEVRSERTNTTALWTSNPHDAVRFTRREDAARIISTLGLSGEPVEHVFLEQIEQQWQPIESAPKDGTRILTCYVSEKHSANTFICKYEPDECDTDYVWLTDEGVYERPTHWQPLPPPPTGEKEEAR